MKKTAFLLAFITFWVSDLTAQTGCTDAQAKNFNSSVTVNDGSCTYSSTSIKPLDSYKLNPAIVEASGLIEWDGFLYTHNDNADTNIYQLNKSNGEIVKTIHLSGVKNVDWEEISQDDTHLYIADIGNNVAGNRKDLTIYKIAKASLATTPEIETIHFSYSNQTDFTAQKVNNTDFDCEAFVVTHDGIYLFTKQWVSEKTAVYQLPKTAGTHVANLLTTLDVSGMVTGATLKENLNLIALCGYNSILSPFVYLIYDFKGNDFAAANKRKINVSLMFHQVEGIATSDGLEYYLINEKFTKSPFINSPQKLHKLALNSYLGDYVSTFQKTKHTYKTNN